jgi:hypothetical protein
MHFYPMSDKELALDSIRQLPEDTRLETITERLEFLAAIRKGSDQIERGETRSIPAARFGSRRAAYIQTAPGYLICNCRGMI